MAVQRIAPKLPAHLTKTYSIASPLSTHTRVAACAEVECEAWRGGWVTMVDEGTVVGQRQAEYIRTTGVPAGVAASAAVRLSGARRYTEARDTHAAADGTGAPAGVVRGITAFTFPPGTECFAEHRVPVGRPELFIVKDGDWRGNPRGTAPRQHTRPEHWVEDFADHQGSLAAAQQKG